MDKKSVIHLYNGILHSREKEGAPTLWDSMNGNWEHYAKWNKPDSKGQIPYDLTFKWNLINKTNKQAKQNQRHWNKEQTYSNQRGGGRGTMGENRGRNVKEPEWAKPKWVGWRVGGGDGWVGSGCCREENGDNCTWTTIKNIK